MSDDRKIEPFYQQRAKELVDMLFDTSTINPDLSRDGLQAVEDFVAYTFQTFAKSADRCIELRNKCAALRKEP